MKRKSAGVAAAAVATLMVAPLDVAAQEPPDPGVDVDAGSKAVPESETGSYVVVMEADPLIASIPQEDLDTPAAEAAAAELEATHDEALEDAGLDADEKVQGYTNALNGFSAILDHKEAIAVAAQPEVALVLPDELLQVHTDASPRFLGLTGRGGAYARGITGEGVVVGIIDTGIWPEHPSFADDGSYDEPPVTLVDTPTNRACNFGNTAHNPNDAPFTCNNKLIGARDMLATYRAVQGATPDEFRSARDDDGHGTHTASTAAGNAGVDAEIFGIDRGEITGIAHRAHVIAYKGLGNDGGFTSDLAAAIDQAVADGVDVINYSIGGGANLIGGDEIAFLFAADAGVFVAASAGNSGPDDATVGGPGDVPWLTTVGASTQKRFFEGTVKLHRGAPVKGASITPGTGLLQLVDAEHAGGSDLCLRGPLAEGGLDPAKVRGKIVLCRRGATGRAEKSLAVFEAGGAGMILYNNSNTDNLFTDNFWVPTVHIDHTPGLKVKGYIDIQSNPRASITDTGKVTTWPNAPGMTIFSSRGPNPTADDIIKPDITAPGLQILAGASPFPDPESTPPGELFQAIAGTSMSSPHVAGFYALMKQAHPDWSAAMAKSAIMTTAHQKVRDNDRVSQAGPFDMGSGHLDPGKPRDRGSAFRPGLVYDAGINEYFGFLCGEAPQVFRNPAATCGALEAAGIPTDPSDLNYPSIGIAELTGTQTVTRTVTSVASERVRYRVKVEEPPGYDVEVTPDRLTLDPGESGSYEVTITNDGTGVFNEWAFGSLTWKGGGYDARSPIAVKGSQLGFPPEINGTGVQGEASFDVTFGYTGPYQALAHGLVPAHSTPGEISRDTDQTYPSPDDGAGVDKIPFTLTNVEFARWELAVAATDDIDLYLENPAGEIIASSTGGSGADELIELTEPANGTYTMVVHGWAVPTPNTPYNLLDWIVPSATGGSLRVDSAPTQAVIGETGTVEISWSGLNAGTRYVGAVSHNDGDGSIGHTIVNVAT